MKEVRSCFYILDFEIAVATSDRLQINQSVQCLTYYAQLQILRKGSQLQVVYLSAQIQEFADYPVLFA